VKQLLIIISALVFILTTQLSWAQIPQTISYQGILTDDSSVVVPDGTYSLTFSFYDIDTGGTALWSETHASVTVVNGLFNVILGSVDSVGNPLNLPFDQQYWLGVQVDGGAELTPRVQLTSVPYSLNARSVADDAVTGDAIADGEVVRSLNGMTDDITLLEGANITITPGGNILTISAAFDGWRLTGNAGTNPAANFLGTTDDQPLELRVFGARVLRLEPGSISPNIIGGYSGNSVTAGVYGATIGGGGSSGGANTVTDNYGTVSGGFDNQAGDNAGGTNDANYATVGGGQDNTASNSNATVSGGWNNTASGQYSTIGGGRHNTASGDSTTVGGGYQNTASTKHTVISGGRFNEASNQYATIGGGYSNEASGLYSTVPGGRGNNAGSSYSFAAGRNAKAINQGCFVWGDSNEEEIASTGSNQFVVRATGGIWLYSNIYGTSGVKVPAEESALDTVSDNGLELKVNGNRILRLENGTYYFDEETANVIAGYSGNSVGSAVGATIAGGGGTDHTNRATGNFATVGGGRGNEANSGWATVSGGLENIANGQESFIGSGRSNVTESSWSTIGGGRYNQVTATFGTIAGGGSQNEAYGNSVAGYCGSIGGGKVNKVFDKYGTIGGGYGNQTGDDDDVDEDSYATVAGGRSNQATGLYSAIPGGRSNEAWGHYSFAAGRRAIANHHGSFVWGDSVDAIISSSGNDQFVVRASGGVYFKNTGDVTLVLEADTDNVTESDNPSILFSQDGGLVEGFLGYAEGTNRLLLENRYNDRLMLKSPGGIYLYTDGAETAGVYLSSGGSGWNAVSDKAMKSNIRAVDGKDILNRLSSIPISQWSYKTQNPSIEHIGPMAQDFHKAFGLGEDNKSINSIDSDGVALAAIQGLHELVKEKEAKIAAQESRISDLESRLAALEAAVLSGED